MLDIYNLLNSDPVTNFNLFSNDYKRVIAVLDPRVFQLGIQVRVLSRGRVLGRGRSSDRPSSSERSRGQP